MNTTRRAMLAAPLSVPVLVGAVAAQAAPSNLLTLCAEHARLNDQYRALDRQPGSTEADYNRLMDRMQPLQDRIIAAQAKTLEEVRAKAGVIRDIYDGDEPDFFCDGGRNRTTDVRVLYSILADLGVR